METYTWWICNYRGTASNKMDKQYSRMLQILNCYYKDEELDFNGESFEQFAQWITDMLNKVDKSKNLELK